MIRTASTRRQTVAILLAGIASAGAVLMTSVATSDAGTAAHHKAAAITVYADAQVTDGPPWGYEPAAGTSTDSTLGTPDGPPWG